MLLLTFVSCKKSNDVNPTPESPDTISGECYCGDIVESYSKIYYPLIGDTSWKMMRYTMKIKNNCSGNILIKEESIRKQIVYGNQVYPKPSWFHPVGWGGYCSDKPW